MPTFSTAAQNPFVAVFIDAKTEKSLGRFPYDRLKTAQAIAKLYEFGAKGVVVKYFIDQPRPGTGDDTLALEIKKLPVLFQAQFDESEKTPNPIPEHFNIAKQVAGNTNKLLSGTSGWIPLEKLIQSGAGIGFVDVANPNKLLVPLVVKYQSMIIPSLWLTILELVEGTKAKIIIGKDATIGKLVIPLNEAGEANYELPMKDTINSLSFIDLLEGKINRKRIYRKIIILGVDIKTIPTFETKIGKIRTHRLFYHSLVALLNKYSK
jgi:hypothetical protein